MPAFAFINDIPSFHIRIFLIDLVREESTSTIVFLKDNETNLPPVPAERHCAFTQRLVSAL